MKTGEGKTLVSTLPAYLNALAGKGVHLVTTNDYLARRDASWMGQVHQFLGLDGRRRAPRDRRPGAEAPGVRAPTSRTARTTSSASTTCATTWPARPRSRASAATSSRSSTRSTRSSSTRRARRSSSPGRADDAQQLYFQFARIVKGLQRDRDYEVDEAKRTVVPTEEGIHRVEQALDVTNLYEHVNQNFVHQLQAALRAQGAVQARRRLRRRRTAR